MILAFLVGAYRAFPLRPHCNRAAGIHSMPCRMLVGPVLAPDWCKDLPGPIPD